MSNVIILRWFSALNWIGGGGGVNMCVAHTSTLLSSNTTLTHTISNYQSKISVCIANL